MKFSLSRTIRKILYRKKLYAVVVTQITIGMLILNIFSSLSLNIKSKLNTLLLENKNMEFYITAKYKDDDFFDPLNFDIMGWGEQEAKEYEYEHIPFDTMVLNILKDTFTDYDFELVATVDFHALTGNSMKTYTIYYSSLYDFVSISTSALDDLSDPNTIIVLPRLFPYKLDNQSLTDLGGEKYNVKIEGNDDNVIFIPFSVYEKIYHPKDLINIKLTMKLPDAFDSYDDIRSIISILESNSTYFLYSINSDYFNLLRKVSTAYEQAGAFNFFALIIMLIIVISLAGMFSLIINSRKKELAICLALGSSKGKLYLECFLEVFILSLSGCLIGIILSYIILLSGIEYATVPITPNHLISIFEILLSCIITLISVFPAFIIIKKLMPMEILRTE